MDAGSLKWQDRPNLDHFKDMHNTVFHAEQLEAVMTNENGWNANDENVLLETADMNVKAIWDKTKQKITGFWDNGIYKELNQADERLQMLAHTAVLKKGRGQNA